MSKTYWFLILTLPFVVASCFPTSIGFKDGSIDPNLKFFVVENFDVAAANAPINYPIQFTEFLKDGVVRNTKLKLVPTEDASKQLIFRGEITRYDLNPVSVQTDNQAAQTRLSIGMRVDIENLLDAEKSMNFNLVRFADFSSDVDFASVETQLLENINEQLLQDILNKLQSDW